MGDIDKKNIPKCPVDENHTVKINSILRKTYYHCKECCEDVAFLSQQQTLSGPPPLPIGRMNQSYSLYMINNPHTSFQTVHGVLTTMLGLDSMMADQVAQNCHDDGDAYILSKDTMREAQTLLDRANNWLDSYEPKTSTNNKRNLVIEIRID